MAIGFAWNLINIRGKLINRSINVDTVYTDGYPTISMAYPFADHLKDMWLPSRIEMYSINRKCSVFKYPPPIFLSPEFSPWGEPRGVHSSTSLKGPRDKQKFHPTKVPPEALMSLLDLLIGHDEVLLTGTWVTAEQPYWKVFIQPRWWLSCSFLSGVSFTKSFPGCVIQPIPQPETHMQLEQNCIQLAWRGDWIFRWASNNPSHYERTSALNWPSCGSLCISRHNWSYEDSS